MKSRGKILGAWLGHPVTVVALLVLLVNDHILKEQHPGLITGKLSDAAGLVLAPPLLALLVRRPAVALWSVGAGFALVKSFGYGAQVASGLWSVVHGPVSIIRADVTDLVTLPFLGLAWWAYRSAERRPEASRWVRAFRMAVLLPLALGGVAATSAVPVSYADRVASTNAAIFLFARVQGTDQWAASIDDGVTWEFSASSELKAPDAKRTDQACSKAKRTICYRIIPGTIGAERSEDAGRTWTTDWQVSHADRRRLTHRYTDVGSPDEDLVSVAVAVHDTTDGKQIVALANGRDGFAIRDADGVWQRIGFPEIDRQEVPALGSERREETLFRWGAPASLGAVVIALVVTLGAGAVRRRWWIAPPLLVAVPGGMLYMGMLGLDPDTYMFYPFLLIAPVLSLVGSLAVAIGATTDVLSRAAGRAWWAVVTWAFALLAGGVAAAVWWYTALSGRAELALAGLAVAVAAVLPILWGLRLPPEEPAPVVAPPIPYANWRPGR